MKRFLFAGLFLLAFTICSCSRKKTDTEVAPLQTVDAETIKEITPEELSQLIENNTVTNKFDLSSEKNNDDAPVNELSQEEIDFASEEERMGTDVLSFLEDEANFTSPIIQTAEPAEQTQASDEEQAPLVESVEKRLLDSYSRLKVMEFDTEIFIPVSNEENTVLIHYSNKAAVRLFYDELFRLTKKEYWKMDSIENAALAGVELYSYLEQTKRPQEKIIKTDASIFVSKLDENGLVNRTEKYAVTQEEFEKLELSFDSIKRFTAKKNAPDSVTNWTYDQKNRITSETVKEGQKTKKQVFDYSKADAVEKGDEASQELPPDYEYYENGMLVTKTEYTQKGVYSTTIWFDSENSVKTDYENYVKVRDVYYTNGVQRRVKNYE